MQGEASTRLGFTDAFRAELAWAKLLAAVRLLAPVPARLKEWASEKARGRVGLGGGQRACSLGLSHHCGVAARARASAGPLEEEQRVANQDPKNPAQMKASRRDVGDDSVIAAELAELADNDVACGTSAQTASKASAATGNAA